MYTSIRSEKPETINIFVYILFLFYFQQYPIEAGRMSGSSHGPVLSRDSQKYPGSGRVQRAGRGPFEAGFYSCCERRSKVYILLFLIYFCLNLYISSTINIDYTYTYSGI